MHHNILTNIKKNVTLTEETEAHILSQFRTKKLKKRQFLLHHGEICQYLMYVQSGVLRIYSTDDSWVQNNVYFAADDWWVVDLKSFIESSPARFDIQALVDCDLLSIHKLSFERLLADIPELERWFRILLQNALISSENRISDKISLTAERRYEEFLKKYPTLEMQISQKHIASYLGITAEHLSKIKSRRIKQPKP